MKNAQAENNAAGGASELTDVLGFHPDWVDFRNGFNCGVDEAIDEVKQLCRDYCARNGSVFIGDVLANLDAIKERTMKPNAPAQATAKAAHEAGKN